LMKAQFAMIESVLSLFAILSAVSLVASQMNANSMNLNLQRGGAQRAIAVYDIMTAIQNNASANVCVLSSPECAKSLASEYIGVFGINSLGFTFGVSPTNSSYGNSTERCLPIKAIGTNETEEVCAVAES